MSLSKFLAAICQLSLVAICCCFRMYRKPFYNIKYYGDDRREPMKYSTKEATVNWDPGMMIRRPKIDDVKLGVLLLNLGGPESTEDVEGFLFNLFADPDIIRLPSFLSVLQKPIAYVIAKRRAPTSTQAYKSIGGGSPIVQYTQSQAQLIQEALTNKGFDCKCYFAMRYWKPFTEDVLDQIEADEINNLVIVPLYPQYSISTSGSSLKLLQDIFYRQPEKWGANKVAHTVVPSWYQRPGYITVMADLIIKEIGHYSEAEMQQGVHILYSAHGVPESYIEAGDPYKRQIEECVRLISREVAMRLGDDKTRPASISQSQADLLVGMLSATADSETGAGGAEAHTGGALTTAGALGLGQGRQGEIQYHLSYQSRVGPVQWLTPYTEDTLEQLGSAGVKNLVVVPVSFVSEHVETLEEIDMEYREVAEHAGVTHWRRVPALNTDAAFIDDMANLVVDALEAPALSLSECIQSFDLVSDSSESTSSAAGSAIPGLLKSDKYNSRFAILGLMGATIYSLLSGHPVIAGTDHPLIPGLGPF